MCNLDLLCSQGTLHLLLKIRLVLAHSLLIVHQNPYQVTECLGFTAGGCPINQLCLSPSPCQVGFESLQGPCALSRVWLTFTNPSAQQPATAHFRVSDAPSNTPTASFRHWQPGTPRATGLAGPPALHQPAADRKDVSTNIRSLGHCSHKPPQSKLSDTPTAHL